MKCPSNINDLMKALAELLDEKFVEHDEEYDEGPSVTVDSYAVVWWDRECEAIGFTPALHPFTFRDED